MKLLKSSLLLCLLLAATFAIAQGVGASGDITGNVTDASGAAVKNAKVVALDAEKGVRFSATTDDHGHYRLNGVPPSTYTVSAEYSGFQTAAWNGVGVTVGKVVTVDFHLKVSSVQEKLIVATEVPIVETERSHQADTVEEQYIRELPIDRRDYLTYTLLMPGVTDATKLASSTDFRVVQTPQSGLSFYGSNGRGNSVTVDGGEANDDAGGIRLTVSQEAVQEFQINRSNYSADLGGASGASINIVTKSGTNKVHGSLFAFFRNDGLDAADPFAFGTAAQQGLPTGVQFNPALPDAVAGPVKNSLNRQQFGGSVGFPIKKDKTFLFLAYEGLRRDEQAAVPLLTSTSTFRPDAGQAAIITGLAAQGGAPVPCLTGQPALPSATCAAILQNILTVNPATSPLNKFAVGQFYANSGLFPFGETEHFFSARFDHQISERDQINIRYNFGWDDQQDSNLQALTGFSRGDRVKMWDHTLQFGWFRRVNNETENELRLKYSNSELNVTPNDAGGVGFDIQGFASLGRNIFLPNFTIMRRWEAADNVTMTHGRHTIKFGGDLLLRGNHSDSETFFAGRFQFGALPGGILSPCLQVPAACGLLTATPSSINSLQSFSLGLPQFYQQGFGNPTVASLNPYGALYVQDTWKPFQNFTLNFGMRYEIDKRYTPLNTDKDNFAPRISFAWDPFSDHKTVVRGGYGVFYSPIYYQIDYVVRALGQLDSGRPIAQVFVPLTGAPGNPALTSAAIFQTLFAQGVVQCTTPGAGQSACITPGNLTQFGINVTHTGPLPPLSVLFSGQPDFQNPYSQQFELGVERELGASWSVSASYIHVHTLRLPRAIDTNLLSTAPTITAPNGLVLHNWSAPVCATAPPANPCFANPLLLQGNVYTSTGGALYDGGIFQITKRFSHHFSFGANYTYSRATDDATDYNSDFEANDQANLQAERALSDFDQRHKFVLYGTFKSPWDGGPDSTVAEKIFGGFELSPIVRANSGRPFNLLAGADVNGDRHATNDRPLGAGRNTGHGPDFATFDLRLARQFKLGETFGLQLMAEAFNLLNRTNFASVNNVVGPAFTGPFNVQGSSALSPSTPLGFTSAYTKREVQLGLRIIF